MAKRYGMVTLVTGFDYLQHFSAGHVVGFYGLKMICYSREVLIKSRKMLQYGDLLYAVCFLRLLWEFDTLLSIYIMYILLIFIKAIKISPK